MINLLSKQPELQSAVLAKINRQMQEVDYLTGL